MKRRSFFGMTLGALLAPFLPKKEIVFINPLEWPTHSAHYDLIVMDDLVGHTNAVLPRSAMKSSYMHKAYTMSFRTSKEGILDTPRNLPTEGSRHGRQDTPEGHRLGEQTQPRQEGDSRILFQGGHLCDESTRG